MARLFGPMPGTYHGPYPTREETRAVLGENGTGVVQRDLGSELLSRGFPQDGNWGALCTKGSPPDTRYVVANWRGETLIVLWGDTALLFEKTSGTVYATYVLGEE